ncbi:hypothetical protein NQZ68_026870 [Dissostichus eleginoides]|nr:hypothetical protein NQZ68_026870 [Dissostichus eleginoides]
MAHTVHLSSSEVVRSVLDAFSSLTGIQSVPPKPRSKQHTHTSPSTLQTPIRSEQHPPDMKQPLSELMRMSRICRMAVQ